MEVDEPMTSSRLLPPPRGQPTATTMPTLSSSTTLRPPPPGYTPLGHSAQNQYQQAPRSSDPYTQSQQHASSTRTNSSYTLHPSRHASTNGYATPLQSNHPSPYTPPSPSGSSRSGDGVSRATQSPHRDQLPSLHQLNLPPPLRLNQQTSPYPAHQQPARLHPDPNPPYPSNGARSPYDSRYGNHHAASVSSHDSSDDESDEEDPRNIHVVVPNKSVGRLSLVTSDVRSASSTSSRSGSERA